jgi:hypothetical protein
VRDAQTRRTYDLSSLGFGTLIDLDLQSVPVFLWVYVDLGRLAGIPWLAQEGEAAMNPV